MERGVALKREGKIAFSPKIKLPTESTRGGKRGGVI